MSYLDNGKTVTDAHNICKLRRVGPAIAMTAGFIRANDFDALSYIRNSYKLGESLHDFALRLLKTLPDSLGPALNDAAHMGDGNLRKALTSGNALEVALIGEQEGQAGADVLLFSAHLDTSGHIAIGGKEQRCPGDCPDGHSAFFLGVHDAIDKAVSANPALVATATVEGAKTLSDLEYSNHPDLVGGPQSLVRADVNSVSVVAPGACVREDIAESTEILTRQIDNTIDPDAIRPFRDELDRRLAAATNLVCHQTTRRYSATGSQVHQDTVDANLRIIDNREVYTDIRNNGRNYERFVDIPGAWASGDLVTMLRVTREAMVTGKVSLLSRVGNDGFGEFGVRFERPEGAAVWTIFVDSAPHAMAFEGTVWFSAASGVLRQIDWQTTGPVGPPRMNIGQVTWKVSFSTVNVSGEPFLAPAQAFYEVKYRPNVRRDDQTLSTFSDFRRFAGVARMLD